MGDSGDSSGATTITEGPLQAGLSQISSREASGGLLGYVLAEAGGRGQLQRWVLHADPRNAMDIVRPPAPMASWRLSEWTENLAKIWRPNSFYIWAQADLYRYGDTYEKKVWNQ